MDFIRKCILLAVIASVLTACGGGGGGGDTAGTGSGEVINGISVPPTPDATANQASVAGVDSNNNGVRDDIERTLATDFGTDTTFYAKAKKHAATEQAAITNPTPETVAAHLDVVRCTSDDQELVDFDKITKTTLDTPARRNAYAQAFAGTIITIDGCQSQVAPSSINKFDANLIFINGIQNTVDEATESMNKIRSVLASSANHQGSKQKIFSFSMLWNPIGFTGSDDGPDRNQDLKELFLLKAAEEKYGADFQRIMVPFNQSKSVNTAAAARVNAYLDDMTPGDNHLEATNRITDKDMVLTQNVAKALAISIKNMGPTVVVAHSQGNLLANLAYAKLVSQFGNDTTKMVRIVNVANTSAFSVNNLNFTHAADKALFPLLQTLPSTAYLLDLPDSPWWRSNKGASDFAIAAPTFGVPSANILPPRHSIKEVYLSTEIVPLGYNSQGVPFTPDTERFVDRFEDFVYAATESLILSNTGPTAYTISGTIHSGSNTGPVLAGATVSIGNLPAATTDSGGMFTISGITGGTYTLYVTKTGFANYTNHSYFVGNDQIDLNFYMTPVFSMSGRIHQVDNNGPGLPGAIVSIAGSQPYTNSNGDFYVPEIPAGIWALSISRPGFDTYTNNAYEISGNQVDNDFYLYPTAPFGVVAFDVPVGQGYTASRWGVSWNYSDLQLAAQAAVQRCGSGCTAAAVFGSGTCAAHAEGINTGQGPTGYTVWMVPSLTDATSLALTSCTNLGLSGCHVTFSACNP